MKQILMLTLATFIWGLGFAGTRWTLDEFNPTWSNTVRFLFAASIAFIYLGATRNFKAVANKGALICALFLGVGLQLQTVGVAHTSLAKSGFLTVFYALFTPILCMFLYRQKFRKTFWLLLGVAFFGMALLCELKLENFNYGDFVVLLSSIAFSGHILATDYYGKHYGSIEFNLVQCIWVAVLGVVFGLTIDQIPSSENWQSLLHFTFPGPLWGFIIVGLFSSIIAFALQVEAQKGLSAHIVGLIFLMESLFCAFFGKIFFDENLSLMAICGGGLVLVSVALIPKFTQFEKA